MYLLVCVLGLSAIPYQRYKKASSNWWQKINQLQTDQSQTKPVTNGPVTNELVTNEPVTNEPVTNGSVMTGHQDEAIIQCDRRT